MKLNTIYSTFNGEVNVKGIGSPAIFLRLQGCHLRCYKKTMGILCDTPEGLERPAEKDSLEKIVGLAEKMREETGINFITLTGGDPLYNLTEELDNLFTLLVKRGFTISVETSGTISWLRYMHEQIHWVLDYKLQSAGVGKCGPNLFQSDGHMLSLKSTDFIKFVIYDEADMQEAIEAVKTLYPKTTATLALGAFWGGKLTPLQIHQRLTKENLVGLTVMNFQVHKLILAPDYTVSIPTEI